MTNFKKPGARRAQASTPGLKSNGYSHLQILMLGFGVNSAINKLLLQCMNKN